MKWVKRLRLMDATLVEVEESEPPMTKAQLDALLADKDTEIRLLLEENHRLLVQRLDSMPGRRIAELEQQVAHLTRRSKDGQSPPQRDDPPENVGELSGPTSDHC